MAARPEVTAQWARVWSRGKIKGTKGKTVDVRISLYTFLFRNLIYFLQVQPQVHGFQFARCNFFISCNVILLPLCQLCRWRISFWNLCDASAIIRCSKLASDVMVHWHCIGRSPTRAGDTHEIYSSIYCMSILSSWSMKNWICNSLHSVGTVSKPIILILVQIVLNVESCQSIMLMPVAPFQYRRSHNALMIYSFWFVVPQIRISDNTLGNFEKSLSCRYVAESTYWKRSLPEPHKSVNGFYSHGESLRVPVIPRIRERRSRALG